MDETSAALVGTTIVFGWMILSVLVGAIARSKGGSFVAALLLSLILSPFIGLLYVLLHRPRKEVLEQRDIKRGALKRCPYCAEPVRAEATFCKHCGKRVQEEPKPPRVCPECFSQSSPDAKFCRSCGKALP